MNPGADKVVYLDNNATTRVADEVVDAMLPYLKNLYGNPSSMHTFGGQVMAHIELAREQVAKLLGAQPSELVFTSCGTESDNAAILGALEALPQKRHVITTRVEHPAVRTLCAHLKGKGYRVTELGVNPKGLLDVAEFTAALTDDTAVASVMHANNETGVIFPVEDLARIAKARGVVFHTDAVQSAGKLPIDMSRSAIDLLSISGHKLHAPKGVGALYVRRGTRIRPFVIGGHQERGRRGGTENVAGIVGLGKACELAAKHLPEENSRVKAMRDRLEETVLSTIPDTLLNGDATKRLPNTSNISFSYVEGEAILLLLSRAGIAASSGSACTSGALEPSHVLRAMGVPFTSAHGSVRFSLSRYNTEADIDFTLASIGPIIAKLRMISPFSKGESKTCGGCL
ncbi:MAG: cysteine desulfurase NifS [Planctomycetota bacterium]|nr:cysteine desulfurase NifS [Planctomycetota bacterium]